MRRNTIRDQKRYRKFGVPKKLARSMTLPDLKRLVKDLGCGHLAFQNPFLPGIVKNVTVSKSSFPPGDVSAYSDDFGFTRLDIEGWIPQEVRILLFLERSQEAYPEFKDSLQKHFNILYPKFMANDKFRNAYMRVKGTHEEEGPKALVECSNCGGPHLYEKCLLPYIYIILDLD